MTGSLSDELVVGSEDSPVWAIPTDPPESDPGSSWPDLPGPDAAPTP